MVEPFFFGPNNAFALYHPPTNLSSTDLLITCPPFFDEYQRCYRALANLADACASTPNGTHAIRFDYSGTGEARGLLKDVALNHWIDDIESAIEEGLDLTGANKVILVGVRFGATLASQCKHNAIIKYLFWDPINTGQEFLDNLGFADQQLKSRHADYAKDCNRKLEDIPYVYFQLNSKLKEDITNLSTKKLYAESPEKVWIITTNDDIPEFSNLLDIEFSGFDYDWPPLHHGNLVPKQVLEKIFKKVLQ